MKSLKHILLAIVLALGAALPAAADQTIQVYQGQNKKIKSVVFKIGVPYYVVNNEKSGVKMDVEPFEQDGRTFVPVRFLGNAVGIDDSNIVWNDDLQRVQLIGDTISVMMVVGDPVIETAPLDVASSYTDLIGGPYPAIPKYQTKRLDVAPVLRKDRTFLPARYVLEALGYQVTWDEKDQLVICWPQGQPQPDISASRDFLNSKAAEDTQPAQPAQPPVTGQTIQGYNIPAGTDLALFHASMFDPNRIGEYSFAIQLHKGNVEQQFKDAEYILSQHLDADTVAKAIAYARTGVDKNGKILWETFYASNGLQVNVGWGAGDRIQFDVLNLKG